MSAGEGLEPTQRRAAALSNDERELSADEAFAALTEFVTRGRPTLIGVDLAPGPDRSVYLCRCGFSSDNAAAFLEHVEGHHAP